MRRTLRSLTLVLLAGVSLCASGQLITAANTTPSNMVQNVLLGPGIQAFNVKYNGVLNPGTPQPGSGTFTAINSNLGLASGVILASGLATNVDQPGSSFMSDQPGTGGDPDLLALAQTSGNVNSVNDRAVLEFDFIPQGDSLKFRYVFGSEEYPEFVCSFNDAFGFFLSGPGISGPYSNNAANIALVPSTSMAVTINNVNNGLNNNPNDPNCPAVNPQYYVNNSNGATVVFDAFTAVFTARASVQCGQTYHIKLGVADANDAAFDSGVFLEGGSFQSNIIDLSTEIEFGGQDSSLYEGCGIANMVLTRPGDSTDAQPVQIIVQGQAINGVDYSTIPSTVTFGPGEDSVIISVNALLDGLTEGPELIELYAIVNTSCGDDTAYVSFYITDAPPILLTMSNDAVLPTCLDSAFISGTATGGYGTLFYDWSAGPPDNTTGAWVQPPVTTTYVVTVTDECGVNSVTGDVTVTVPPVPPLIVAAFPDTTVRCPEITVGLNSAVIGGTPPYTYHWSDGLGNASQATVAPPLTQTWTLTVTDLCGLDTNDQVTVTVVYDSVKVFIAPDTTICKGDTAFLVAYASLGTGAYTYEWNDAWTDSVHNVMPAQTSGYFVTVTDECDISATDATVVLVNDPSAQFTHNASNYVADLPIQFTDQSVGATQWHWDFGYEDLESDEQYPTIEYPEEGTYTVMLTITDDLGCVDSTYQLLFIDPQAFYYLPTSFSPDGDGINETFGISGTGITEFEMRIFDRWGELVFSANDASQRWDGTYGGVPAKTGVYVVWFRLQDVLETVHEHRSQVTLLK